MLRLIDSYGSEVLLEQNCGASCLPQENRERRHQRTIILRGGYKVNDSCHSSKALAAKSYMPPGCVVVYGEVQVTAFKAIEREAPTQQRLWHRDVNPACLTFSKQ